MSTSVELAGHLFVAPDRLGWEYCEPLAPQPFPNPAPVWVEPPSPDTRLWESQKAAATRKAVGRGMWSVLILLLSALGGGGVFFLALCGTSAWIALPIVLPSMKINQARQKHQAHRASLQAQFQSARAQWDQQVALHNMREQERFGTTLLWYPLQLMRAPGRVDVFGGTGHGWASLIVTFGSSLLASGTNTTILDLSDQHVARELAGLATDRGVPVGVVELPGDGARLDLLSGLDANALAELLAEAVQVVRRSSDGVDQRAFDVELLQAVTSRLEAPVTFARIVAGLRVLRRIYDVDGDATLSAGELRALTAHVDLVGSTDRVQHELQFLTSTLEILAAGPTPGADPAGPVAGMGGLFEQYGVCVLGTSSSQRRHKEIIDSVVFHRLLEELRDRSGISGQRVLVVAGADRLGLDGLEDLTGQARRLGLRLVLLFEHLRGDLRDLVGGADSTTVFMRLGNFQEADAAAQQIGRGQKFVLSQLTRQIGETLTTGTSFSEGVSEGDTIGWTEGGGRSSDGLFGTTQRNWSSSESFTRTESWQKTTSESMAQSQTDGVTVGRVHEFIVEPTQIQGLPHTAFLMVDSGGSGRRIVLGDCNPGISLLPRVAAQPLPAGAPGGAIGGAVAGV